MGKVILKVFNTMFLLFSILSKKYILDSIRSLPKLNGSNVKYKKGNSSFYFMKKTMLCIMKYIYKYRMHHSTDFCIIFDDKVDLKYLNNDTDSNLFSAIFKFFEEAFLFQK